MRASGLKNFPTMIEVVAVAMIAEDSRVLMQRRAPGKAHAGLWEFPGGKIELGESVTCALVREIEEELGLRLEPDRLTPLTSARDDANAIVISLYTCLAWHGVPQCLDAAELGWFEIDALLALAMPPLDVPLAQALKELLTKAN